MSYYFSLFDYRLKEMGGQPILQIERLDPTVPIPRRASPGSAGYDFYNPKATVVKAKSITIIPMTFKLRLAKGYRAQLYLRSGVARTKQFVLKGGVIDSDYHQELFVVLQNDSEKDINLLEGEALAQFVISEAITPKMTLVGEDEMTDDESSASTQSPSPHLYQKLATDDPANEDTDSGDNLME